MKQALLVASLLLFCLWLSAEIVSIGTGTLLNVGLPIEPVARYSYSQQLFLASEIGPGGMIDALSFHYNVNSTLFYNGNKQWKIWLGHSSQSSLNTWIPTTSMVLVYDGILPESSFSAGLPGTGWLNVALNSGFNYNGYDNLLLAVDENTNEYGNTSDDFYCTNSGQQLAIQFQSASINPDPENPPATGFNLKTQRSNLKISIQAVHYYPVLPYPANNATGIPIDGDFSWTSVCSGFSLELGTHPDSLMLVASNLTLPLWQSTSPLDYNKHYYWKVTGTYQNQPYPSPLWSFTTCSDAISPPRNLSASAVGLSVQLNWQDPVNGTVQYYRLYRNSALLSSTPNTSWLDTNVQAGNTYYYFVCAIGSDGSESGASNIVSVSIPNNPPVAILTQGFETCAAFSSIIPDWQNLDVDGSLTWAWDNISFPHEGEAMGWLTFAPGSTVPPLTDSPASEGSKMLMAMSSLNPPNNDWLISPAIHPGQNASLSFKARSLTDEFGLERLRVLISTTDAIPASFSAINQGSYLSVPTAWTSYSYDLAAYQNQRVFLAWQCVSFDSFALFLDDIKLLSTDGWVDLEDDFIPLANFCAYPNPAKDSFTIANKSGEPFDLEMYDLKGRKLYSEKGITAFNSSLMQRKLASGIYLLRLSQNGRSQTFKQVLAK